MRMSCNGCRVLRKGCSDNCSIRPCLQWIKSPQSQANATVFLAKFYGRAGLINLINAGLENLRPAIFKSLLYEACGRIINPIYGSSGLLWTGNWQMCQAAVEAVLKGEAIMPVSSASAESHMSPPLKACDIRHVSKTDNTAAPDQLRKIKSRTRFKRSAGKPKLKVEPTVTELRFDDPTQNIWPLCSENIGKVEHDTSASHEWLTSHRMCGGVDSGDADCSSVETVETSLTKPDDRAEGSDVVLDLTLGFGQGYGKINSEAHDTCTLQMGIDLPA